MPRHSNAAGAIKGRRLIVVAVYSEHKRDLDQVRLEEGDSELFRGDVRVDHASNTWTFTTFAGKTELFSIGSGMRTPEGGIMWGPAFVYDPDHPGHVDAFKRFEEEFRSGQLSTLH